jgi:hypothetical protein
MTNKQPQKSTPKYVWLLILIPIVLIGTCNVYLNTHQENAILENPQPGDYFVFRGLMGTGDQPFKLVAIHNDTMEFLVPRYELINFKINGSESTIYELDKKGELYYSQMVLELPKATVDSLIRNSSLAVKIKDRPNVYLKGVFGPHREDAVTSTLEKLFGEPKKGQ